MYASKLDAHGAMERKIKSLKIREKLFELEVFKNSHCVCFYVSLPSEVDTGGMIEEADKAVAQALGMIEGGYVTSLSGKRVAVAAETLCIHGDQPGAAAFARALRKSFAERNITVAAP